MEFVPVEHAGNLVPMGELAWTWCGDIDNEYKYKFEEYLTSKICSVTEERGKLRVWC